ncbi:hypothetical protein ACFL5Q_04555 [Planctomycetota bacterium]
MAVSLKGGDVGQGPAAERLKERPGKERMVEFFQSPEELAGQVIHALAECLATGKPAEVAINVARHLHPQVDFPAAPIPYIAPQYSLSRTRTGLAGRRVELNLLTDWIARPETVGHARVLSLVAIGGQGKSALSWHWFNSVSRTGQVCTSPQKIWQELRDVRQTVRLQR